MMQAEFLEFIKAAGAVFGFIGGGAVVVLAFKIGSSWSGLRRDVSETKCTANRTETTVDKHAEQLQAINMTLHGPLGDNGLYSDVRSIKAQLQETPGSPRRRRTDKRKAA